MSTITAPGAQGISSVELWFDQHTFTFEKRRAALAELRSARENNVRLASLTINGRPVSLFWLRLGLLRYT